MTYLKISKHICDYNCLKKHIKSIFLKALDIQISKKGYELGNFQTYFKNNFNISLDEFINKLVDSVCVGELKNNSILFINENEKIKDKRLTELISFIDYGNRNIRGCNLIYDTIKYIERNFNALIICSMIFN